MTKTKRIKKAAAVLVAVIMTFAVLGITAFANGSLEFTYYGSSSGTNIKIVYTNCDSNGKKTDSTFKINNDKDIHLIFSTTVPSTSILFFKDNEAEASAAFTTPKYVSGMPSTLSISIKLKAGKYKVGIKSAGTSTVSGYIEISSADGVYN